MTETATSPLEMGDPAPGRHPATLVHISDTQSLDRAVLVSLGLAKQILP